MILAQVTTNRAAVGVMLFNKGQMLMKLHKRKGNL